MSTTIGDVPKDKLIELPVMEESQMGMRLGMAMAGKSYCLLSLHVANL
jgi:pyruvate/2-oxoglutarate/acetoin dehydrogenase E1 component